MTSLLRPLSIAEILDGAFAIYRVNIGRLLAVSFGIGLPLIALAALSTPLAIFLQFITSPLLDAALIWICAELIKGGSPTPGVARGRGLRMWIPLAALSVGYIVLIMLVAGFVITPAVIASSFNEVLGGIAILGSSVVMIFVLVTLFAWRQVIVVEREWNFVRRSARLARGGRWRIILIAILSWLLAVLPTLVVTVGQGLTSGWDSLTDSSQVSFASFAPGIAVQAVVRPFTHALFTLLYFDRRVQLEGFDVEQSVRAAGMTT